MGRERNQKFLNILIAQEVGRKFQLSFREDIKLPSLIDEELREAASAVGAAMLDLPLEKYKVLLEIAKKQFPDESVYQKDADELFEKFRSPKQTSTPSSVTFGIPTPSSTAPITPPITKHRKKIFPGKDESSSMPRYLKKTLENLHEMLTYCMEEQEKNDAPDFITQQELNRLVENGGDVQDSFALLERFLKQYPEALKGALFIAAEKRLNALDKKRDISQMAEEIHSLAQEERFLVKESFSDIPEEHRKRFKLLVPCAENELNKIDNKTTYLIADNLQEHFGYEYPTKRPHSSRNKKKGR